MTPILALAYNHLVSFAPNPNIPPRLWGHPSSLWGGSASLQTDLGVDWWWEQVEIARLLQTERNAQVALPWRAIGGAVISAIGGAIGGAIAGGGEEPPVARLPVPAGGGVPVGAGGTDAEMARGRTITARWDPVTGQWMQVRRRRRRKRALSCQDKADIAFLKGQGMSMDKAASLVMSKC